MQNHKIIIGFLKAHFFKNFIKIKYFISQINEFDPNFEWATGES